LVAPESQNDLYLILFLIVAAATDYFDGYLSRKMNQVTELGKILDPIADKIAMGVILVTLIFYRNFPVFLVVLLIYRDVMILTFGLIITKKTLKATSANLLGKLNTAIVAITMLFFLLLPGTIVFTISYFISVISIIVSGINYYFVGEKILFTKRHTKWFARIILIVFSLYLISLITDCIYDFRCNTTITINKDLSESYKILKRYSPVFYHSNEEKFFPIKVESFLNNSKLVRKSDFIVFDKTLSSGKKLNSSTNELDENYYLKMDRSLFDDISYKYYQIKKDYPLTVYARAVEVKKASKRFTILQYWLFYWASYMGSYDVIWHECDWEVVMYLLDDNLNPIEAGYSQHYYGEVKKWEDVGIENGKPVVYVSSGGHSMYFIDGIHNTYLDNSKIMQLGTDQCKKGIKLIPENYNLEELNDSIPWLNFKGDWGLPITTNLKGPKFRNPNNGCLKMWSNPLEWFDNYRTKKN
jgi:CDP-diacylglycerol--glycerol-3-phosphate 3-phosphatidyltransferase